MLSVAVTCSRRSSTVRISWTIHSSRRRRCWRTSGPAPAVARPVAAQANQARVQRLELQREAMLTQQVADLQLKVSSLGCALLAVADEQASSREWVRSRRGR